MTFKKTSLWSFCASQNQGFSWNGLVKFLGKEILAIIVSVWCFKQLLTYVFRFLCVIPLVDMKMIWIRGRQVGSINADLEGDY